MKRVPHSSITILLLGAFALRLYALAAQPLSGDEAFTVTQWGTVSTNILLTTIAKIDPQPPVALLSYSTWLHIAGHTEFAARSLSALFSLLAIAGAYALAKSLTKPHIAALATFVCATNPFQLWYAQDARPYSEWLALSLLAFIAFQKALTTTRLRPWLLYTLLAAITLQTFYLEAFSLLACNIYAVIYCYRAKRLSRPWLLSQAAILATFLPWFLSIRPETSTYQPTAAHPNLLLALTSLLFGETLPTAISTVTLAGLTVQPIQILVVILTITAISTILRTKPSTRAVQLLILEAILPLALITILSLATQKAYFHPRYIAISSIPLTLLVTLIPYHAGSRPSAKPVALAFLALLLAVNLGGILEYRLNPKVAKAPPWREIAGLLTANATSADIIIQNYPDPALAYYYLGPAPTTILPASENPDPQVTVSQLSQLPLNYQHLWFIRVDTPFWDRQQIVANWLAANTAYLTDIWIGNMRIYQYASWTATDTTLSNPLNYDMGTAILRGYRLTPNPPITSLPQTLTIELFWQPLQHSDADLHIFTHLTTTDPDGGVKLWSQDDHPPQQGRLSTTTWPTTGTIFRDIYHIPLPTTLPNATYILTAGFYNPQTSTRIHLPNTIPATEPDAVTITTISIATTTRK